MEVMPPSFCHCILGPLVQSCMAVRSSGCPATCCLVSQEALRMLVGLEQEPLVPTAPQAYVGTAGLCIYICLYCPFKCRSGKGLYSYPLSWSPHIVLDTLDVSLMDYLLILEVSGLPTWRRVCVTKHQPPNCSPSCYLIPPLFEAGCPGTQ